ncbi:MAG: prepilin-type N-terminal cleavage/methylation domain-containing protein [Planctomycetota bacterium]|nr:prepilin-type N-terminal cleavage/methylation domain-containing protein [Planctomycetota bacterium]
MIPLHPARAHRKNAFTLLEISVVLVLISLIAGGALVLLTASVQQAQFNQTVATMQAIEDTLLKYRLANNRLPCPGDLTIAPGDPTTGPFYNTTNGADYGLEAGADPKSAIGIGTGACTGTNMTPTVNYLSANGIGGGGSEQIYAPAAEGAVPSRALRLPDSYMFDGWGNHISYAVDISATISNAFTTLPNASLNACGPIIVCDVMSGFATWPMRYCSVGHAPRSSSAIYALLSHGANGYGAYTQNGSLSAVSSSNTNEQTNARAIGGYWESFFVQQLPGYQSGHAGDSNYYFDDIVTFKERWQLQSPQDSNPPPAASNGLGLVVGGGNGAIYPYQQNGATFAYFSPSFVNPVTAPAMTAITGAVFSPDNKSLAISGAVTGSNPGMIVYSVAGGTFTTVFTSLPGQQINSVSYSADGRILAANHTGSSSNETVFFLPFLGYQSFIAGGTPAAEPAMDTFSPDGKYKAYVQVWSNYVSGEILPTPCNPNSVKFLYGGGASGGTRPPGLQVNAVNAASFSNDDQYLAIATASTVSGVSSAEVLIFKLSPQPSPLYYSLHTIAPVAAMLTPGGTSATGVAFSHSGNTLAVTTNGYPFLYFYRNNGNDTFTAFSPVAIGAGANASAVAWSRDDQFVAVSNGAADTGDGSACGTAYGWCGLALYQVIGTTVNPLSAVASPPGVNASAVAFTN